MLRYDTTPIMAKKTDEGFILDKPIIGRTGLLRYKNADGSDRWEYRPPDEAFNADSLASIRGKPITIKHVAMANADNASTLPIVGSVLSDGFRDGENIRADVSIFSLPNADRELSCGYSLDLDETPGTTPDGKHYDAVQRNIKYNHLAIVPRGRAGNARLNMDGDQMVNEDEYNDDAGISTEERKKLPNTVFGLPDKMAYPMPDRKHAGNAKARAAQQLKAGNLTQAEYDKIVQMADKILNTKDRSDNMGKIRLDSGLEYDCAPEVKVSYEKLRADQADNQKKIDTLQGKFDAAETIAKKAKEDADKAKEEMTKNFDSAVKSRVTMLAVAKEHKIDKADELTDKDIKIQIIKKVNGDSFDIKDKSDEYIDGVFDMCRESKVKTDKAAADVRKKINGDGENDDAADKNPIDAMIEAQEKLRADEAAAWKGGK